MGKPGASGRDVFEQGRLPIHLGYLKLGSIRIKRLNIVTGGIMGDESEDACRLLLQCARQVLSEKQLDMLVLSYVPTTHILFRLATSMPGRCCRDWGVAPSIHWRMTLPATFEEFLKNRSKKHRYWLNRLPRVLEEAYPGRVRIRSFTGPGDVEDFCRDADAIARTTYQHQLGEAFRADEDYPGEMRAAGAKGSFARLHSLCRGSAAGILDSYGLPEYPLPESHRVRPRVQKIRSWAPSS